ncbi:GNAT family N-acetyltransferase [Candidatus Izimaplasma bacterium]|nr:GNAT family N-acetyltransferase [Candidatus Izimaplasma bacterium]
MRRFQTKRLTIRPMDERDVDAVFEMLRDPKTMEFFVEGIYNKSKVREIANRNKTEPRHYVVMLNDTFEIIGKISWHEWFMKRTYEIGWIFNKKHFGNGYATEAAKRFVKYGFTELNLHRIIATCQPENIPSKRVCEKLNMRLEGTFKKCIHFKDDEWWDELFYGLLKEDYKE